jgi:hypothetical protein
MDKDHECKILYRKICEWDRYLKKANNSTDPKYAPTLEARNKAEDRRRQLRGLPPEVR